MAIAVKRSYVEARKVLQRHYEAGIANTALTATSSVAEGDKASQSKRVIAVYVKYSATPVQTGVVITLDSGLGTAYDTVLYTGSANVQDTFWQPSDLMRIAQDDAIKVLAPAAGGVITATVQIVLESDEV